MHYYLVEFRYEHYCQGYEWATTHVLVQAYSFKHACAEIEQSSDYMSACDFKNKTLFTEI